MYDKNNYNETDMESKQVPNLRNILLSVNTPK